MGALNDLSFLLIIYFLVIAGFNTNYGFLLDLPSKNKTMVVQKDDLIKLTLDGQGQLYYKKEPLTQEKIKSVVEENLKVHPNMTLFLSISPDVPYQYFVDSISLIRELNVENFSFKTEGPRKTE